MTNFERFLQTYSGKKLLQEHSLETEGTWEVLGEDANAELAGHHYQPRLGVYSGKLVDVIATAVELVGFWQWGAGGNIIPISVKKADKATAKLRAELVERENALKQELESIQRQLKSL